MRRRFPRLPWSIVPRQPRARQGLAALAAFILLAANLGATPSAAAPAQQGAVSRMFPETGYTIHLDPFWVYFQQRGGVRTHGYPTSNALPFLGCATQFFQRLVLQQCGEGAPVRPLNLLDEGLLPYTRINGSVFPATDPALAARAPRPDAPGYAEAVAAFVREAAPEAFEGEPVRFGSTFLGSVRPEEAFPAGDANPVLLPLLALEVWGFPTSAPQRDPGNPAFIYQRFQRGIMHYDRGCGCTQGLLLADYLKALIIGEGVPADLLAQAQGSPLYRSAVSGLLPPGTNYVGAFHGVEARTEPPAPVATPPPAAPTPGPRATPSATPRPALPTWSSGPYRIQADPALHPVFGVLLARNYTWVLDRLTVQEIQVSYLPSNEFWGAYIPGLRVIFVNSLLRQAAPETVAALMIHEGSHVNDFVGGRLNSFNECISSERVAAEQEGQYWRDLWGGVTAKPNPANAYEQQLNFLVRVQFQFRTEFEDFLKEIYYPQCSRYPGAPSQPN